MFILTALPSSDRFVSRITCYALTIEAIQVAPPKMLEEKVQVLQSESGKVNRGNVIN